MENQPNWALLARYVAGECSLDEERDVQAWIQADPSRKQLIEQLRRIWDAAEASATERPDSQLDMEAEWQDMRAKMRASDRAASASGRSREEQARSESRAERRPSRSGRLKWATRSAAAILLLVGGLWLTQTLWMASTDDTTAYREVVTEEGERSRIQLADGSSVMLNVDSKLRLANAFGQQKRIVRLTGEAYFEIETDPNRPFIVKTGTAAVEVHGTAFNVRGYPEEKQVQVAVTEGDVSVRPSSSNGTQKGVELRSGMVGRLTEQDTTVVTEATDVTTHIGWTEGRLVFENTPLPKVVVRLERWYGMDVTIQDASLDSLRLTADLKSQAARNVLDVIAASLGIQYRIDQNTVLLMPRGSSR